MQYFARWDACVQIIACDNLHVESIEVFETHYSFVTVY